MRSDTGSTVNDDHVIAWTDEAPAESPLQYTKETTVAVAEEAAPTSPRPCWHIVSNSIFVVASVLYLVLAVLLLDEARFYKDVPVEVLYSTDDGAWWQYYNETNAFDDGVLAATDDMALSLWFNNSFYPNDRFAFQVNPQKESTIVNQYMIVYFLAAMGFLLTGMLDFWLAVTKVEKIVYSIFIVAAAFGVVSSMLLVANDSLSSIFNAVSVHLFAVEAISILIRSKRNGNDSIFLVVGHVSFVIGTVMDMVLSYFFVLGQATFPHAKAGIAAACFWLLCSLIYLWNSVSEVRQRENHEEHSSTKREDTESVCASVEEEL
ncbi:hypothetical protein IV203_015855 [Nitzschia inconspicua]|uniref:Transmembrane protein n=1 Tax=Nitzschia inconspicua TaxID=303405 RepID=A0A9K3LEC8_9STRA|nr:hypothetical protein IV203_015855 [Nitzschia inconspicua]